jgi:DNA gyrase subunit A
VQRNAVSGISVMGRPTQGVRVMNLKKGDVVSAVALVVESANGDAAKAGDIAAEEAAVEEAVAEKGEVKAAKKPRRKPPPKKK